MSPTDPPAVARCPRCGSTLSTRGGICLRCLAFDGGEKEDAPLVEIDPGFSAGRCIGDYELLEEVGRGGMGVVFKARQKRLDRVVAIKVLRAGWLAHAGEMARFRSEAKTVGGLHHQNIVAIHEVGEHDGQPYFSMDFVAGRTLEEIARGQPLPPARAARYVKLIAEAIQYAHERGVLHRDLKPSNVLLDADDQPRVTDFGLAKRLEGDAGLTMTGQVLGSPNFMPPEQASEGFEPRANFAEIQTLITEAWTIAELHSTESLHLKHVLAFYGRDWIHTWAKTEPSAVAMAAAWQDRLTELQRQHPELRIAP